MRAHAWAFVLALAPAISGMAAGKPAMSARDEARALIGIESTARLMGEKIAPDKLSCIDSGGGYLVIDDVPSDDWADGMAECQGRMVMTLARKVGVVDGREIWRIVDTLLLPPLEREWDPRRPNALMLVRAVEGVCGQSGRPGTSFTALIRWGKRKRIDWRTGVERAWTSDIVHGRIVPMSTRHIFCEWVDP